MRDVRAANELKAAREARGWSLAELSARTSIRVEFLRALEEGDFSALPERPFARGYLRRYAAELGVDPTALLATFDQAKPPVSPALRRRTFAVPVGLIAASFSALAVVATMSWWGYAAWNAHDVPVDPSPPVQVTETKSTEVRMSVDSTPVGARVYLDNRFLGVTPFRGFPLEARATAELRVEHDGFKTARRRISLTRGRWLRVKFQPTSNETASIIADVRAAPKKAAKPTKKPAGGKAKPDTAKSSAPDPSKVTLTFVGESWVRVTDKNGGVLFEGIPPVGSSRTFPAGVRVRVGSAGSVRVNGAVFGEVGQVVERALP